MLSREKEFRGKKTDFYDAGKLEDMVDKARGYEYSPLKGTSGTLPLPQGHGSKV